MNLLLLFTNKNWWHTKWNCEWQPGTVQQYNVSQSKIQCTHIAHCTQHTWMLYIPVTITPMLPNIVHIQQTTDCQVHIARINIRRYEVMLLVMNSIGNIQRMECAWFLHRVKTFHDYRSQINFNMFYKSD